jgi:hypothetical protein
MNHSGLEFLLYTPGRGTAEPDGTVGPSIPLVIRNIIKLF